MNRTVKRDIASLPNIFSFIEEFISEHRLSASNNFSISFVVEELFTNMVKYNPEATGDVSIGLEKRDNKIVMILVDQSTTPFDITKAKAVDTEAPLSNRRPGGLGIYLVKRIADSIQYEFDKGVNRITVIKQLEN